MMKEGRKELPRLRDDSVSVYRAVGRSENPGGGGGQYTLLGCQSE